jgi:hypothetical protein
MSHQNRVPPSADNSRCNMPGCGAVLFLARIDFVVAAREGAVGEPADCAEEQPVVRTEQLLQPVTNQLGGNARADYRFQDARRR